MSGPSDQILSLQQLIFAENWERVVQIVVDYPKEAETRNWANKTPLHVVCEQGSPLAVIKTLLGAFPSAVTTRDVFGFTPLHVCFATKNCPDIVRELIKARPEALSMGDKQGFLPLHRAFNAGADVDVLVSLIEHCPDSVGAISTRGSTPLDAADMVDIQSIFNSKSERAKNAIGSVLHWACRARASDMVSLSGLVRRYPDALQTSDGDGSLPLHVALRSILDEDEISELLFAFPDASAKRDGRGNYPLHCTFAPYRLARKGLCDASIIRRLIDLHPSALTAQNRDGQTPLHLACHRRRVSLDTFKTLLGACKGAMNLRDNFGKTPLETFLVEASSERNANFVAAHGLLHEDILWEMLIILLRYHFAANGSLESTTVDSIRNCTLHWCLKVKNCPKEFLWVLAAKYPEQIRTKDDAGQYPLHVAAACLGKSKDMSSFIQDIMCQHPAALHERDNNGRYPISLMVESGRPWGGGVREAVIEFPEALLYETIEDNVFPNLMARACSAELNAVFEMMRGRPDIIKAKAKESSRKRKPRKGEKESVNQS